MQFIALQQEAVRVFNEAVGSQSAKLRAVMEHFGVSFTACRYQVWNGLNRWAPLESLTVESLRPPADAQAQESFTADYFPIDTPITRRGRFCRVVVAALDSELISMDTAAEYLCTTSADLRDALPDVRSLFQ